MDSILGIIPIKFTIQNRAHIKMQYKYKIKTLEIKEYIDNCTGFDACTSGITRNSMMGH